MSTESDALREVAGSFSAASDRVATALREIKDDLKRSQHMRRLLVFAIALDLCVTVAAAFIITLSLNNNGTVHVIKDCTETSGQCYQRNAKAQGDVLSYLNDSTQAAALCVARTPQATLAEIQACVSRLVPAPTPTPSSK